MQTIFTIDDDVADLLSDEVRRSGQPFGQTVNRLLRSGLTGSGKEVESQVITPFKVRGAVRLEVTREWTSGCVQELLDMMDGADRS